MASWIFKKMLAKLKTFKTKNILEKKKIIVINFLYYPGIE